MCMRSRCRSWYHGMHIIHSCCSTQQLQIIRMNAKQTCVSNSIKRHIETKWSNDPRATERAHREGVERLLLFVASTTTRSTQAGRRLSQQQSFGGCIPATAAVWAFLESTQGRRQYYVQQPLLSRSCMVFPSRKNRYCC